MKNRHAQLFNLLLITAGAVLIFVPLTTVENEKYLKSLGIVLMMYGLYRATNQFIVYEEDRKKDKDEEK